MVTAAHSTPLVYSLAIVRKKLAGGKRENSGGMELLKAAVHLGQGSGLCSGEEALTAFNRRWRMNLKSEGSQISGLFQMRVNPSPLTAVL